MEANDGKENPKFKEKKKDGYQTNCTLCTVTHLLRRRGFNIEASPNLPAKNNTAGKLYDFYKKKKMNWEERFLNKDESSPTYISSAEWSKRKQIKKMTDKHLVSFLNETLSNDGLYEIAVAWKDGGEHVFCAEVVNGEKHYFDPQNGESNVSDYLKKIEPYYTYVLRIDDKIINPKIGSLFLPIK
ncbi:MAG: toxin glutamine deamidase domain-containing protein [Bacteroidales bacterium]|nr:toxin glutamine deamidase domain-containing protein [Bacteroidales bacterium]